MALRLRRRPLRNNAAFSRRVTIGALSSGIVLIIFRHYLSDSPPLWVRLAHVCRRWRQVIFSSPLGLRLRLYCTHRMPALRNLDCWPPFPLVVNYGGFLGLPLPAPEDEDNIMAALQQSDRVCSISLTVSSSLLQKLSTISEPFSDLEELVLLSQDNDQLTLPGAFWWGHRLRTLHSTRIAIPSLPQLLSPSQDLVDLQLHEIPGVGYFPPEAFANALCGMTQLETLSLHFLSFPSRRNYLYLPPPPEDHVVLPALTSFKYRGISKYLDSLVVGIDAPRLEDINITFFGQPTLDASQLGLFINRIEMQRLPLRAENTSSKDAIFITFTQPGAFTRLGLQISCEKLDWQLSSISQICDHFSSFLFHVEDLDIKTIGPSRLADDMDDEQWVRPIRAYDGAKDFRVAGDATNIFRALRLHDEGHKNVLPALRNLHIQEPIPVYGRSLRDSVQSFVTQRPHPVQIYYSGDEGSAEAASNTLNEILRAYPPALDTVDPAMASFLHSGGEFIDIGDTPTPDLVTGSSPQTSNIKSEDTTYEILRPDVYKEISGGDAMSQYHGWNWEGHMDTPSPDQVWLISTP
ncbi:hypothetical protein EDB89DRAFT_1171742 [Lactarius sanguifluus]|nr:hypothetical protein EDB89DRAFT_1171742 [Lactarius sanguifluus]